MEKTTVEGKTCLILKEDKLLIYVSSPHLDNEINAGLALTQPTTAVSTPGVLGGTSVEVETPAVPRITNALKVIVST